MNPQIYFISGVCGVGKSAVIPHLKKLLPKDGFDVRDFDERGVPDGADQAWRKAEIAKWIEVGADAARNDVTTIVCGFVKTKDFAKTLPTDSPKVEIIILDATPEIIRKRLEGRYSTNGVFDPSKKVIGKPVTEFIESNVYYCKIMREESKAEGLKIIDTSNITPEEVAQKIIELIPK